MMADVEEKVKVKTCSESDTSSCSSLDNEEDMPYDVLLQNSHMISVHYKKYKEKYKIFVCENTKLKKSSEDLEKENLDMRRNSKSKDIYVLRYIKTFNYFD